MLSYILLFYIIWRLTKGRIKGYHTYIQSHFLLLNLRVKFVYLRVKSFYLRVAIGKDYLGI